VQPLAVAAIQVASLHRLGVALRNDQAAALASLGSVAAAVHALEERLRIRRQVPGLLLDDVTQVELAVREIVLGHARGVDGFVSLPEGVHKAIGGMIVEGEKKAQLDLEALAIKQIVAALESKGGAYRRFVRGILNHRSALMSEARAALGDASYLAETLEALDHAFLGFLERARDCLRRPWQ